MPIDTLTVEQALQKLRGYFVDAQIETIEPRGEDVYEVKGRYRLTSLFGILTEKGTFTLTFKITGVGAPRLVKAEIKPE